MNDIDKYNNFVIYKIYQKDNPEMFYIGSTKNFNSRKTHHKKACYNKRSKSYKYPLYKYIRALGGWEMFNMIVILEYPIKSRGEGLKKEQEIMDELKPKLNAIKSMKIT
jgi:predicted GIY-YIG superfamily endonuclease